MPSRDPRRVGRSARRQNKERASVTPQGALNGKSGTTLPAELPHDVIAVNPHRVLGFLR